MKRAFARALSSAALLTSLIAAAASAQPGPPPAFNPEEMQKMRAAMEVYNRLPDTPGEGPYAAAKMVDPAFPDFVIYRPADLGALGDRKLPILLWGNGGCSDDGASQRLFLENLASYGFFILAPGTIKSGPGAQPAPEAAPPAGLMAQTTADQMRPGLDEAVAANHAAGPLNGRLDESRMAVAGYSCGGLQALQLAGDQRIKAVVIMHSGLFSAATAPIKGMNADKSLLKTLHTPLIYIEGGPRDIAYNNGADDVARIDTVPVIFANHDVGHGGTFLQPNGGEEAHVALNWLEWQLLGDQTAGQMFSGPDCGLCRNPAWTVQRKGF